MDNENAKLRLVHAIPTGVPITVPNDALEMLRLFANKTIKDLSKITKGSNILANSFTH